MAKITKKQMVDEMVDNGYMIPYGPKETKESLKKYLYRRSKEDIEEHYNGKFYGGCYLKWKEKKGK